MSEYRYEGCKQLGFEIAREAVEEYMAAIQAKAKGKQTFHYLFKCYTDKSISECERYFRSNNWLIHTGIENRVVLEWAERYKKQWLKNI